ncbi:MAG: hypothetical protein R3C56_30955 [Pirellulaceae bacterium]
MLFINKYLKVVDKSKDSATEFGVKVVVLRLNDLATWHSFDHVLQFAFCIARGFPQLRGEILLAGRDEDVETQLGLLGQSDNRVATWYERRWA